MRRQRNHPHVSAYGALLASMLLLCFSAYTGAALAGKLGIMGDSIIAGTHSSQACGDNDIVDCFANELGEHSPEWSYVGGDRSWSIASRLGYGQIDLVDASDDGERWDDALDQAQRIMADSEVDAVFIGLGANDVCRSFGHDFGGDLQSIAEHVDDTLRYLTDRLPPQGRIFWSGVLDIVTYRDIMASRDHHYLFESCQGTWDLDPGKIKADAAIDVCNHFFAPQVCQVLGSSDAARSLLIDLMLERWFDIQGVAEGPCGRVLDSRTTEPEREQARQFNIALNGLMAEKARAYDGRNGIAVHYTDAAFAASQEIKPYHLSRLDCYHPNRTGQMKLAEDTWRGFNPGQDLAKGIFADEFDSRNYCDQEFTTWDTCWMEIGENCGPTACDVQILDQELRVRNKNKGIWRGVNLAAAEEAWAWFTWRREALDSSSDSVSFDISSDGGVTWVNLDRFEGGADDHGMHRGRYYDITPYATADTRIRFLGSAGLGDSDRVYFDNLKLTGWFDPGLMPSPMGQATFIYPSTPVPLWSADPEQAEPLGVGSIAGGGQKFSLKLGLAETEAPVDLYLLLFFPAIDPDSLYVVTPGAGVQPVSAGLVPWRSNITGPVDAPLFGDIPVTGFPAGSYYLALMAASPGSLADYSLWATSFVVP